MSIPQAASPNRNPAPANQANPTKSKEPGQSGSVNSKTAPEEKSAASLDFYTTLGAVFGFGQSLRVGSMVEAGLRYLDYPGKYRVTVGLRATGQLDTVSAHWKIDDEGVNSEDSVSLRETKTEHRTPWDWSAEVVLGGQFFLGAIPAISFGFGLGLGAAVARRFSSSTSTTTNFSKKSSNEYSYTEQESFEGHDVGFQLRAGGNISYDLSSKENFVVSLIVGVDMLVRLFSDQEPSNNSEKSYEVSQGAAGHGLGGQAVAGVSMRY